MKKIITSVSKSSSEKDDYNRTLRRIDIFLSNS